MLRSIHRSPASRFRSILLIALISLASLLVVACGSSDSESNASEPTGVTSTPTAISQVPGSPYPTPASNSPSASDNSGGASTSTSPPVFAGYDLDLATDDFWRFKWEWTDTSCAQRSGCSKKTDDGVFQVALGEPREWLGVTVFEVIVSGDSEYYDDPTTRSFAPRWDYLGVVGHRLVATDAVGAAKLVTIFDGQLGKWAGSGFFTSRTDDDVLVEARSSSISGTQTMADWGDIEPGDAHVVGAADSQGKCEVIEGRKICPREESFDYSEREYFRADVGPLGYEYRYAASFSGGGFNSSYQTEEKLALVASSFLGDDAGDFGKPTPVPPTSTPVPTPTPVVLGSPINGPTNGQLHLAPAAVEIPEFESGVSLKNGVVDVVFRNPNVSGKWSYGVTFRNSGEETFHAVFVNSDGQWGHFARGGSLESQQVFAVENLTFDRSPGAENRITVWFGVLVDSETGLFQINNEDVALLDLSYTGAPAAGDVSVMSGLFPSDEFDGSATQFFDFQIFEKP